MCSVFWLQPCNLQFKCTQKQQHSIITCTKTDIITNYIVAQYILVIFCRHSVLTAIMSAWRVSITFSRKILMRNESMRRSWWSIKTCEVEEFYCKTLRFDFLMMILEKWKLLSIFFYPCTLISRVSLVTML